MKKIIHIQTQNLTSPRISSVKAVGWVAINTDNIRIIIDAYTGTPCQSKPRDNSVVRIVDDRTVREMTAEKLLEAVKFFEQYSAMGDSVVSYKNMFHKVIPDRYLNARKQAERGLKI